MADPTRSRPRELTGLSVAEKRELVKNFLSLRRGGEQPVLPLSFGQQALWVVYQLAPASPAYNFLYAADIKTNLDVPALEQACQILVDRHPALRSIFRMEDGKPVQEVLPRLSLNVPLSEASSWNRETLLANLRAEADRPFDLERGPALRIHLYRRGQDEHVVLLVFHHIIADLWSMEILVQELQQLYHAETTGHGALLPPLTSQFADFVRWQMANVYGPSGQKSLDYWLQELAGDLPVLHLPTDRPRPAVQTYNGNAYNWPLDPEAVRRLRELVRDHGGTLFVGLLAIFQVLLHRYSGQNRFLVGTATADRGRPDWERLVGYFINQVALRVHLDGSLTFASLLQQTRDRTHQALAHQDYPFGLLVKRLQPRRDSSHPPLFQTMFIWDKAHEPEPLPVYRNGNGNGNGYSKDHGLRLETLLMEQRGAPFDLTLIIFETADRLTASIRYNTDLFDESTIGRMAEHFNTLLDTLVENPHRPLAETCLLTSEEKHQQVEWNRTERPYPDQVGFHQLVERQAKASPQAPAVICAERQVSYGELNARANQLARHLRRLGAGIGSRIGLCLPRSPEALTAILATWKAGAAYIPLDPAYPAARLAAMIDDARPVALLTLGEVASLPVSLPCPVVCLDSLPDEVASLSYENLDVPVGPDHPAYIIFTSGSTGKPKGTVLRHRGLCNLSEAQVETFRTTSRERVLQFASLSFDASVFEIAMALRSGACLVVPPQGILLAGENLLCILRDQRITNATLPPSVLAVLPFADLPDLQTLIVAGEVCPAELVQKWGKGRRFFNGYGPTETTVWATVAECLPDGLTPPIGKPIANTRAYVLDEYWQPVPVGVVGELYLAGPGLAAGYLNQPGLTAEKFVPDPFSDGGLMYRTGDLVRRRHDGMLEFLGRRDQQVKINGFRIELEEIKEVLRQHPQVADAVVLARLRASGRKPDVESDSRLIAYLVPRQPQTSLDPREVRAFLRERLPAFMLPSAMAVLEKLPLNVNGKVDRSALPEIVGDRGGETRIAAPPRNPREEILVRTWARVLQVESVGIHDNFFDLGGASLQTLEVAALAHEAGLTLTPEMIFQYQTVAELAAACGESSPAGLSLTNGKSAAANGSSSSLQHSAPSLPRSVSGGNMVIESLGVYLPSRIFSTEEVINQCRNPINFPLERMTGIRNRRLAGDGEFAIDLAARAVEECLARSAYQPADIDLLICANISRSDGPDHRFRFEPTIAAGLQKRFNFRRALAFDIANACAGTFTALAVAEVMLKQGTVQKAMVVSGEHITPLTVTAQKEIENFLDARLACLTLGDSGLALILEQSPDNRIGFHDLELYTLGKYHPLCVAKASDRPHGGAIMFTDPVQSAAVTIKQAVRHSLAVLQRRRWQPEDIKTLILHQTSATTLEGARQEVNRVLDREVCTRNKTVCNVGERGNTATTTHFVALWDQLRQGQLNPGDKLLFGISGSGQTVGTALYTMDDLPNRWQVQSKKSKAATDAALQKRRLPLEYPRAIRLSRPVRLESVGLACPKTEKETVPLLRAAGKACLESSRYTPGDIELVIHAGVYRSDFILEPALAAIAAGELGMNADENNLGERRTLAFDLANGGVGPLEACLVASQMIAAGKTGAAMVLASEIDNNARHGPKNLLGIQETGSALILEPSPSREGFQAFWFQSFPEFFDDLASFTKWQNRHPVLVFERSPKLEENYLDCLSRAVKEFLLAEEIARENIGLVLPSWQSPAFVTRLAKVLDIPLPRFVQPPEGFQDAFTSSLAQGWNKARAEGRCSPGTLALILAAGAGGQVGWALYRF